MKIPKLFKKAAAFVMAAVTALSIMPATAFAAGDIGTISFSHTYDSNGNAMRYNSSANIGGYTAGGTGNYKLSSCASKRLRTELFLTSLSGNMYSSTDTSNIVTS